MSDASRNRVRSVLWIASFAVIVLSVAVFALALSKRSERSNASPDAPQAVFHAATVLPEPLVNPGKTALDTSGETVPLVKTAPGTLSLLYFGYTNCPDICPLDMTALSATLREMPKDKRDRIRVVFATADPARDTAPVLQSWLANYDPTFIGVVPSLNETNATLKKLGYAPIVKQPIPGSDGYAVAHPAGVYVYTSDDRAHVAFFGANTATAVAHDLGKLLEGWDTTWVR